RGVRFVLAAWLLLACRRDSDPVRHHDAATAPAAPRHLGPELADASPYDFERVDEMRWRTGKRDGVEIVSENLLRAVLDGDRRWDELVDRARGVVERRHTSKEHW